MADDPSSSQPKKHVHTRKQQTQHIRARFQTTVETRTDEIDKYKENEEVQTKLETDNPTADLPVESLFALHRLKYPLSSNTFLFFFLWTPFGIPIFLFRVSVIGVVLIFFYTCAAIPYLEKLRFVCPKLFVNVVFPICGLWHTVRGRENKNAVHIDKCIFVSNHLSNFDPIWFNAIFSDFTLLCAGDYDWFWEAMKRIGVLTRDDEQGKGCIYTRYFGTGQEREEVRIAIEEDMARVDARPFLIYPEGCVTNGYAAVMQYQKFVFGLNKVIVPVCLQFVNPWPFEHYCLSTGAANHLMWYMFSPFVIMKHAILPPQKIRKDESPAFFALRIQAMTAAHLGLGVIRLNWKQKDRLAQAMGFQPYSENFWSRRESMDDFKKAVYDNALVVQGDKIVKTASRKEEERSEKTSFHGRINRFGSVVKRRAVAQQKEAAFMAKEFAAKHNNGRDSELQILDDQMKKLQAQQRARSILPGRNHNRKVSLISPDLNAELVEKINEHRRRNSTEGEEVVLKQPFDQESAVIKEKVVSDKRRNSLPNGGGLAVQNLTQLTPQQIMERAKKQADTIIAESGVHKIEEEGEEGGELDMEEVVNENGQHRGSVMIEQAISNKTDFIEKAEANRVP